GGGAAPGRPGAGAGPGRVGQPLAGGFDPPSRSRGSETRSSEHCKGYLAASSWTGTDDRPRRRQPRMITQERASAAAASAVGTAPAIEARDLVKTYPKGVRALDGLSFAVPAGTVFGLLGPTGAGKSTTVKILTTLAQADSGTATVAGLDVRARAAKVRHAIGVVAQRSGADPTATGRENLLLSGRIQGLRGRELTR